MTSQESLLHLCFDFDETLTKQHIGNNWWPSLFRRVNADMMKGGEEIGRLFELAISKGHKISIVSYNENINLIASCLEAVGVSDPSIRQISFICHLTRNTHTGKIFHMQRAAEDHQIIDNPAYRTILIDDNYINTDLAKAQGFLTLRVIKPSDTPWQKHNLSNPNYDLSHLHILGGIINAPENAEAILARREQQMKEFFDQHKPRTRAAGSDLCYLPLLNRLRCSRRLSSDS